MPKKDATALRLRNDLSLPNVAEAATFGLERATALRLTNVALILNLQKLAFMPRVFADNEKALS
jgi:hypothetical protein